ncbi:IS607 family transposase [Lacticaseibacillus zhaodongensis]|uniref:IS607 family transposase n=1 Tax=Lacticaseibacillus zhaodongensis TaxID=2668065 RepID=UPI0012D3064D|nr:IS607 family transposase [Lacticaseibacillus zhaodongensis]
MLKPKEMAARIGVTVKTLQKWDKDGTLPAFRNPKNRRYYTEEQYRTYIGETTKNGHKVVAYARVSNAGQKDDLKKQVDFLRQYANGKGVILDDVITDVGSGLNYKRKHWNELLDQIMANNVDTVYITYKDRFVRFGYDWFEQLANKFNTQIVVLNNPDLSPQEEMTQDLISIIQVFSCRISGLRKYKRKIENDKELK